MSRKYSLREVDFGPPPGLTCTYHMTDKLETDHNSIAIVSFAGTYPPGSLGNAHGAYISVCAMHAMLAIDAHCVILDFREMEYSWGSALLGVFQELSHYRDGGRASDRAAFPVLVVTSDLCRDSILSLLTPAGAESPKWHFTDLDDAIEAGILGANAWLD